MISLKDWSRDMGISTLCLIVILLWSATSTFAAANTTGLVGISLQGVGSGTIAAGKCTSPAIPCPVGHTCECFTGAQTILGNKFNNGSLSFELSVDTTEPSLPISTAGSCFGGGGFASIANSNGKNTVSLDISGLVCPTVDGGATTFNGTYVVTEGTNFSAGTGAINTSLDGTTSRSSVNGNLQ